MRLSSAEALHGAVNRQPSTVNRQPNYDIRSGLSASMIMDDALSCDLWCFSRG
jgi:hypothetical protein